MATTNAAAPQSPAVFAILLALAEGDKHGYAIMKEAQTPKGGGVPMGPGTLYGTLDRLSEQRLIKPTKEEVVDGRLRRYYGITKSGLTAVRTEAAHRRETLQAATKRLQPRIRGALA